MFLITDMTTGKRRVDTAFASYDDAVTALGGPAECNDFCSRNGCDIIWHDDDECILEDFENTIVVHAPVVVDCETSSGMSALNDPLFNAVCLCPSCNS